MPDRNYMSKCMCGMELLVQFQLNYRKYRTLRNANIYIIRKITEDLLNQAFTYGTIII